jgi:hypothetical protein
VSKVAGLRRRWQALAARRFTGRETPELLKAYAAFDRASQSGSRRQPYKGWDLWMQLCRIRPHSVVELGSGTTSAVFALWSRRNATTYICFEHHAEWAKVTENCLREAGLIDEKSPVRVVAVREAADQRATGFVAPVPPQGDFIYVDGPPTRLASGPKVANDDVYRMLDGGATPRAIVVDGRLDTVDLIRSHPRASAYAFEPSFVYAIRRGLWRQALRGREHTVFLLRSS